MKHIEQTPKTTEDDTFKQGEQIPQRHFDACYSVFRRRFKTQITLHNIITVYSC